MTANPQLASTALTLDVGTAGELGRGFIQRLTLQHYYRHRGRRPGGHGNPVQYGRRRLE